MPSKKSDQSKIIILSDLPKASEYATDFLDHISLEMLTPIAGKDELKYCSVTDADHNDIGFYHFNLQITSRNNKPVLKVTFNIKYIENDITRATDIISNLTLQAKLIEQHYEKHIKSKYNLLREMNVVLQDDGLVFSQRHFIDGRINTTKNFMIPSKDLGCYLPSAFNVLLLKLFARMGGVPKSPMRFIGMDTDYSISEITYTNLLRTKLSVSDIWVNAITIERKIRGKNGDEITVNLLDESGNMLMIIKVGEGMYAIAPGVKHTKLALEQFLEYDKVRKEFDWEEDLEMISQFEYMKEKNKGELMKYQYKNPYWKCIIADFLQQLLVDKPSDALAYTANYFQDFSDKTSR